MGFMDGFLFWLGKQCAEVIWVVFLFYVIVAYVVITGLWERKLKRKGRVQ